MVTQGHTSELERFAEQALSGRGTVEAFGPREHHIAWEFGDRAGSSRTIGLLSGITLSISRVRWERGWTLAFAPDSSKLKLIAVRGPGPRITLETGRSHELVGGTATVSRFQRPIDLRFEFSEATSGLEHEELCLEIDRARLCDLMGSSDLPRAVERVWSSTEAYPFESLTAPPGALRLLDDMLECDARGATRQLHLEAKGLELLAAWMDHLDEESRATKLSAHDSERLECARRLLVARMNEPPSLPELARLAGLNEAKLKAGFRMQFGTTVFGYLRRERLDRALGLLRSGTYSVTEVALRVGYANPSKFAAAFRSQFGVSPSDVR